jgi:sarcosine oxidase subunit delta
MKILNCPINGPRPVDEFAYGGESRDMPDGSSCSDTEWADYVFNRNGTPGTKKEWWYHVPSGTWLIAERNTATDHVERTYLWGEA